MGLKEILLHPAAGWVFSALIVLVPPLARFVFGLAGKNIVITAKPSPAFLEAAKIVAAEKSKPAE